MKHTLRIILAAGLVTAGFAACNSEKPKTSESAAPQQAVPAPATPGAGGELPSGHPPLGEAAKSGGGSGAPSKVFTGKVVETMNASSYTYVLVDNGTEKIWAATPQFDVKKGDKVNVPEGMPMKDYKSETLKKTFDTIYFVSAIGKGDQMPQAAASTESGAGQGSQGSTAMPEGLHPKIDAGLAAKEANVSLSGIKKADKTIADVFANQSGLSGKEVSIRGKVVKFNAMIMGKNWIHLQDGSGSSGTNDLTITTDADAKVGDTVLVQGKVTLDKDFGMGYKYGVIIEDAKVKVE